MISPWSPKIIYNMNNIFDLLLVLDDDICHYLSCAANGTGLRESSKKGGRSKKGRLDRNSDARPGRFQMTYSIRNVRCEEQEKTWTLMWGTNPQEEQKGLKTSPIFSR